MPLEEIHFFRFEGRQVNVCGVPPFMVTNQGDSNFLKIVDARGQEAVWVAVLSRYSDTPHADTSLGLSFIGEQAAWVARLVEALNTAFPPNN